jgi:hypothetical protein
VCVGFGQEAFKDGAVERAEVVGLLLLAGAGTGAAHFAWLWFCSGAMGGLG